MLHAFSKLKIQVNLLKLLTDPGKPGSAVPKGARGYHLQLLNKFKRPWSGGTVTTTPLMQFRQLSGNPNVVVGRHKTTNVGFRKVSSAASYFDYVDAQEVKNEIKDKIYKLLFPNKLENMVDYFKKRKTDDKSEFTKQETTVKTKPTIKAVKPKLNPTPSRKNYASFIASTEQKVFLPKVVNINGVEVINGKIVLDKLEKQKEMLKKEEEEANRIISSKTKLSSREYLYMLNKKHRLTMMKPNKIAVSNQPPKASPPAKKTKTAEKNSNSQPAPPRRDYSLFMMRQVRRPSKHCSLHGIELFSNSSLLANKEEASNPKENKVMFFEHYDDKIAVKLPNKPKKSQVRRSKFQALTGPPPSTSAKSSTKKKEEDPKSDFIRKRRHEFV